MQKLPIIYVRGFAGTTAGVNGRVNDPFYGFNAGSTHIRTNGDGDPMFYQFEGPLLRLMSDHGYQTIVHGDQAKVLTDSDLRAAPTRSISSCTRWAASSRAAWCSKSASCRTSGIPTTS